ncbi:MAG TPA: SpvB/TcaC N-terminal domain-containing protein, partial [Polyangiaceae bacterium]|nr:SpvB/TcaC N-terminal domain-containing protein [Polyangiaceae bacterium]
GEARYEIPLWMPPGRGSMQPSLSLAYDSGSASDEGVLGAGFQVRGFSSIARCPKTISRHGEIRGVRDDEEDAFCFDGRPMVPVDPASKRPTEFRTVPDSFAKIVADYGNWWGWDPAKGPRSFQVFTKDGLVHEYGLGSGWVFAKNNVVRSWLLTKTTDQSGNWIAYQYINDKDPAEGFTVETAPWRILYTGHAQSAPSRAVQFHYKKRESPATRVLFARGMGLKRSLVLDRIEMQAGWAFDPVREYRFQYTTAPATKRLLLASVEECTPGTVCKPPTLFTWHHGGGPKFVEHPTPLLAPQSKLTTVMPADLNGDGFEDWLLPDANAPAGSELPITYWHVAQNRTTEVTPGFFDAPSLAYEQVHYQAALPFQPDRGTILDFNHDGRMYVFLHDVQGQYPTWRVLITQPDLTFAMHNTGIARPFPTGVPTPLKLAAPDASGHLADLSGDGMQDLLNCMLIGAEHVWRVHLWSPDVEGFEPDGVKIEELSVYPCNAELYPVDIDADGKVDLVVQEATVTGNGAFFGPGYAVLSAEPKAGAWGWSWSKTGIPTISPGGRILFLDINGDALPDAVRMKADEPTFWTHYNTGAGFSAAFKSMAPEPLLAHAHMKLATVLDFNGDSRQDILMPLPQAGNVPKWTVLQATGHIGDGTFAVVDPELPFDAVLLDEGVTLADPHGPRVTDFNGDGAQDVLLNVGGTYRVFANSLTNEDLLASVSDGLRARDPGEPGFMPNVQIHYDTLVDRAAATAGATAIPPEARTYLPRENAPEEACDYPVRCVVGPRRVVSGYSIYSGGAKAREFDVAYRNGRYHRLGQGFLGFGERIVRDKATGAGTAELFDNATYDADLKVFPFARQIAHEYRWTPALAHEGDAPEVALELRYTHIQRIFTPSPGLQTYFTIPGVQRQRREQSMLCPLDPLLIEELAHSLAGGGAEKLSDVWRITSKHDAFGNITKEVTFTEGIDGDLTIEREIENDEATWRIGYLKKQTECSSVGALSQCRIGKREYDNAGRLFSEAIE